MKDVNPRRRKTLATDRPEVVSKILLIRQGHNVKRCHAERIIGENTVGQHSAGVASLVLVFTDGKASANLLTAALYHDVPEAVFGDIPAPAKWWMEAEVKAGLERAECRFMHSKGLHPELSEDEAEYLYVADKMEFMFFCLEQRGLGNTHVDHAFWKVVGALEASASIELGSPPIQELFIYLIDQMHLKYGSVRELAEGVIDQHPNRGER